MPLHDHFHEPLKSRRHWTSLTSAWATFLASDLNEQLPKGYFAEPNAQFAIEIDVAAWEDSDRSKEEVVIATRDWSPPSPLLTLPFTLATDVVEVQVWHNEGGPILVGAVELVSPRNKDRPAAREAFVSKCAAFLHEGVGLVLVDVVTERHANLHRLLLARVAPEGDHGPETKLYATAYRPMGGNGETSLQVWHEALSLGGTLPTLPLWLREGPCLQLDLGAAYEKTVQQLRIAAVAGA